MKSVKEIVLDGLKYFRQALLSDTPVENDTTHALSLAGAYSLQSQINSLNSSLTAIAFNSDSVSALTTTLESCSGTKNGDFRGKIINNYLIVIGRISISNFQRTATNPGIIMKIPNNKKLKYSLGIPIGGTYITKTTSNNIIVGEGFMLNGVVNETSVSLRAYETLANLPASALYVVFHLAPFIVEVK